MRYVSRVIAIWTVSSFVWMTLLNLALLGNAQGGEPMFRANGVHLRNQGDVLGTFTISRTETPPIVVWYSAGAGMIWQPALVFEYPGGNVSFAWPRALKQSEYTGGSSFQTAGPTFRGPVTFTVRLNSSQPNQVYDSALLLIWPSTWERFAGSSHFIIANLGGWQFLAVLLALPTQRARERSEKERKEERIVLLGETQGHFYFSMGLAFTLFNLSAGVPLDPVLSYLALGMGLFFMGYRLMPLLGCWNDARLKRKAREPVAAARESGARRAK